MYLNRLSQKVDLLRHVLLLRVEGIDVLLDLLVRVPHVSQAQFFLQLSCQGSLFLSSAVGITPVRYKSGSEAGKECEVG